MTPLSGCPLSLLQRLQRAFITLSPHAQRQCRRHNFPPRDLPDTLHRTLLVAISHPLNRRLRLLALDSQGRTRLLAFHLPTNGDWQLRGISPPATLGLPKLLPQHWTRAA